MYFPVSGCASFGVRVPDESFSSAITLVLIDDALSVYPEGSRDLILGKDKAMIR
jgi:hypothetical protein